MMKIIITIIMCFHDFDDDLDENYDNSFDVFSSSDFDDDLFQPGPSAAPIVPKQQTHHDRLCL